jgi:hypothetical protein
MNCKRVRFNFNLVFPSYVRLSGPSVIRSLCRSDSHITTEAVSQSSREGTSENDAREGKGGQTFLLGLVMSIAAGVCCWRNLSSSFPDISTRNDIDTLVSKNNDNGHVLVFRGRFCPACVV